MKYLLRYHGSAGQVEGTTVNSGKVTHPHSSPHLPRLYSAAPSSRSLYAINIVKTLHEARKTFRKRTVVRRARADQAPFSSWHFARLFPGRAGQSVRNRPAPRELLLVLTLLDARQMQRRQRRTQKPQTHTQAEVFFAWWRAVFYCTISLSDCLAPPASPLASNHCPVSWSYTQGYCE